MSHLQYKSYEGWGQTAAKQFNMSQAVRVPAGEIIKISGQGGWELATGEVKTDLGEEYRQVRTKFTLPPRNPSSKVPSLICFPGIRQRPAYFTRRRRQRF